MNGVLLQGNSSASSSNNSVTKNALIGNTMNGVNFIAALDNSVKNNTLLDNVVGIRFHATGNTFFSYALGFHGLEVPDNVTVPNNFQ